VVVILGRPPSLGGSIVTQELTYEKFKIRAWMKLMHPFNHDEFVKSLLAQFSMSSSHQAQVTDEDNLTKAKLMQQMREQRYLVVLEDDVFMLEEWALIRIYLPDYKNGSWIVLSTRAGSMFPKALGRT
jgi:hypothetical protein